MSFTAPICSCANFLAAFISAEPRSIHGAVGERSATDTMRYTEPEIELITRLRSSGDDLLRVQVQRQVASDRHPDLDSSPRLVGPGDALGQARIVGVRGPSGGRRLFVHFHHISRLA